MGCIRKENGTKGGGIGEGKPNLEPDLLSAHPGLIGFVSMG